MLRDFIAYQLVGILLLILTSKDKKLMGQLPINVLGALLVFWPAVMVIGMQNLLYKAVDFVAALAAIAKDKVYQLLVKRGWITLLVLALAVAPAAAQLPTGGMLIPRDSIVNVDTMIVAQYDPPAIYSTWWGEIQSCTKLHTKLTVHDFAWIGVPGAGFLIAGHTQPVPGWAAVENRTFLVLVRYVMNERLVKHEMTHALMWESGDSIPSHSQEFWVRCEILA